MPYSAILIALLALLLIIVLAVLFYARKAARRNRSSAPSSEYGSDDDVEKAPLAPAVSYQQRDSYAPGDFLHVDLGGPNEATRQPSRHQTAFAAESSEETQPSLWSRASNLARRQSSALTGNVRQRDVERGPEQDPNPDVSRISLLPPAITVEPPTPMKKRPAGRLFSGAKEPKSPKRPRRQKKASGGGSATKQAPLAYGQLAGTISPDRLDHLMSLASAKVPPHVRTAPLPLRKRHVSREAVGAPIVTSPIYPGEMARRPSTALLPVEVARSRLAVAKSRAAEQSSSEEERLSEQLQSPEQALLHTIAEADQEHDSQEAENTTDDQAVQEEEEDQDQHPSPTTLSTKPSRPTSVRPASAASGKRPTSALSGKRTGSDGSDKAKNPFPWDVASSKAIDSPANEVPRNPLSGRPVLDSTRSHDETTRKPSPIADVFHPEFRKQSRTTSGVERRAMSEVGPIDLSPIKMSGFPWGPNFLRPEERERGGREPSPEPSPESSWAGSRRSSELLAAVTSLGARASRASATFWTGSNVDPPASQLPALGPSLNEGTQNQRMMTEVREEESEGQEQPADLKNRQVASRLYSGAQEDFSTRRASTWSASSTYSQEPTAQMRAESLEGPHSVLSPSTEPLKLSRSHSPGLSGAAGPPRASEGVVHSGRSKSPAEGFTIRASPARSSRESPPSPTSRNAERGRMDSIASGIIGFFSQPRDTSRPTSSNRQLHSGQQSPHVPGLTVSATTPVTIPPASPSLLHAERPGMPERISSPRTAGSPSVLSDLAHFRGRRTVTPGAESTTAKPRLRFSEDVEVFAEELGVLSPPPRTIRLLTPPSLVNRSQYTGDILSPQPVSRRGSILPILPDPSPDLPKSSPNISAVPAPSPEPSRATETPPKAVQTREMWREIRRTSATAYYLGAMDAERDRGDEGESGLR